MTRINIGYIVSQFPCYDETFIAREMAAVKDAGADMTIFSIKKCRDKIIHAQSRELLPTVFCLPLLFSIKVWAAVLLMLLTRPLRFLRAFFEIFRHAGRSADFLCKGLLLFPQACAYAREAEKRGITNIHAHWATHPTTMALVMYRLSGIPMSFTGHAHDIHVNTTGLAYKMRQAHFVLTCTGANKGYLLDLCPGLEPERVVVSHHGLDGDNVYFPREEPLPERPFRIVSVGSCLPCKGYDRLLKAAKILSDDGLDFRLHIVGGGPLQKELEKMRDGLGLAEAVTFHGFVTQENMPEYYRNAHCFVLSSIPEIHWGIPNVVAEAMACALPIVTTLLPALPELVDDYKSGFLLDYPEPEKLADAFKKLAENPELRSRMGGHGRARVRELFDLKKNAQQVLECFRKSL